MITLISGTNRKNSLTYKFSSIYFTLLQESTTECLFYDLCELPPSSLHLDPDFYTNKPPDILEIQEKFFLNASKFIFIIPEYNGSFPGILKLLIDVMDPALAFRGKKAAITGIATGRAGNLRGMDHLAGIMHHMGVTVLPFLLPVSKVQHEFESDKLFSPVTEKNVKRQITEFLVF
jgi:chromate reductase